MPSKVFFCYAREDEMLLNQLKRHLRPLQRQKLIELWFDRDIKAGENWEQEIREHLDDAQIILLLISPDFMDSDYCYGIEMKRAIERYQNGEALVIPIILRPVFWQGEPLGKLQALPADGKPITDPDWYNKYSQDKPFFEVAEGIRKAVESLTSSPPGFAYQGQSEAKASFDSLEEFVLFKTVRLRNLVTGIAISPNGQTLIIMQSDMIELRDFTSLTLYATLQNTHNLPYTGRVPGSDSITSLAQSTDGQLLACGYADGTIRLYNGLLQARTLADHLHGITCLAMSADKQILASNSDDGSIQLWNLHTGQLLRVFRGNFDFAHTLSLSPDGQIIVSGCSDKKIRLWNTLTGRLLQELEGHTNAVTCVAVSPDGQMFASGSKDRVTLWNLYTAQSLWNFEVPPGSKVNSFRFSPDGKILIIGTIKPESEQIEVMIWNPHIDKLLQAIQIEHIGDRPFPFDISPDGQFIVTVIEGQLFIYWRQ